MYGKLTDWVAGVPGRGKVQCVGPTGLRRMAYLEWGSRDNPRVLVCVHGLTRCARDFDFLARKLAARYRVVCPDLAGRGDSDWLTNPRSTRSPCMSETW